MPLPRPRRRSPESHKAKKKKPYSPCQTSRSCRPRLSLLLFLLCVPLSFWCFPELLSESFGICVSSRKLNLYCFPAGNQSMLRVEESDSKSRSSSRGNSFSKQEDEEPIFSTGAPASQRKEDEEPMHRLVDADNSSRNSDSKSLGKQEEEEQERVNAIRDIENQLQVIRARASNVSFTNKQLCDGRGVYVYDLPPKFNKDIAAQCSSMLPWMNLCEFFDNEAMGLTISGLGRGWHKTHQYFLEPIFHRRILNHPCRVKDPEKAKLFYVPFYGGLDILRWHFKNVSTKVKDELGVELVQWLETQKPWARSSGEDHLFVLGKISWDFRRNEREWGSNFLALDQMQAPYKFLIEREPWKAHEIGVPHPTHFHPRQDDDIVSYQSEIIAAERKNLVSFAGAARPEAVENIRSVLIKQCLTSGNGHCKFLDCASRGCSNPKFVLNLFRESEFCMQPPGDSPTRKSVFDSLVSGCIPVLFDPFTAYYQYPWHLPEDHRKYSVFVDQEEVRQGKVDVIEKLKLVPMKEREEMRRYIVYELMPRLVYGTSNSRFLEFQDAFTVVMDNMLNQVTSFEH